MIAAPPPPPPRQVGLSNLDLHTPLPSLLEVLQGASIKKVEGAGTIRPLALNFGGVVLNEPPFFLTLLLIL